MKFARYLQDTQVPEWKKAYIDYQGLKKHITAVRRRQETEDRRYQSSLYPGTPTRTRVLRFLAEGRHSRKEPSRPSSIYSVTFPRRMKRPHTSTSETNEIGYLHASNASVTASSQSKTLYVPQDVSPKLNDVELEFLVKLDEELAKVEFFYLDREKEVKERLTELRRQLQELKDHRWFSQRPKVEDRRLQLPLGWATPRSDVIPDRQPEDRFGAVEFRRAKKKLREAVLEHYKKLDALQNYRTLNVIGFQKTLKKWEKATHMGLQSAYLKEKVEPAAFSSGKVLADLIQDTEGLYTAHFTRGDKKRALYHLRAGWHQKTHYFPMFRAGVYLGLAIPALASGLYESFQAPARQGIQGSDGLLLIYATIFIPVFFSLLVGINILVWTGLRINHVFIFGLDVKSKLDYQQYTEIPAVLLSTLCYSFWLSFYRIGSPHINPSIWPLVWLGFNTFMLCNPLPVFYRSSRLWLLKKLMRLLISGLKPVEFTDFWLGDQICSLNFSFTNLFFIGCMYGNYKSSGLPRDWEGVCGAQAKYWWIHIFLGVAPFFCRFVQSLRRWYDGKLATHLVNAGKYITGMLMYAFYHIWRYYGTKWSLVLYILAATLYNTYGCIWDYLTDWSIFRVHAKHPLLRDEVLSVDYLPLYYFAIITNFVIRFSWIIYLLPSGGLPFEVRTFIVATLEMFRRWQWNFLRLENEHLGNIDQYRVTRDVPLPYVFGSYSNDSDVEDWEQPHSKGWLGRIFSL